MAGPHLSSVVDELRSQAFCLQAEFPLHPFCLHTYTIYIYIYMCIFREEGKSDHVYDMILYDIIYLYLLHLHESLLLLLRFLSGGAAEDRRRARPTADGHGACGAGDLGAAEVQRGLRSKSGDKEHDTHETK